VREVVFINDLPVGPLPVQLVGSIQQYTPRVDDRIICAIGDPLARASVKSVLESRGAAFISFVHDDALVAEDARLGDGVVIAPRATISTHVGVGDQAHVNTGAIVSHDAQIGRFATLSPGSILLGGAVIGDFSFIGGGATIMPRTSVGDRVTVGAQALVRTSVADGVTVAGVPARPIV